jgi:hypothetical protein
MQSSQGRRSGDVAVKDAPGLGSNGASRTASEPPAMRTIIELRGFAKDGEALSYMRTCVYCGWFEISDDPRLFWLYRRCPLCDGSDLPEAS